jgi:hypothetical protein
MSESSLVMWHVHRPRQLHPWDCDFEPLTGHDWFSFLFPVLWRLDICASAVIHRINSAGVLMRIYRASTFGQKSLLADRFNPNIKKL